MKAHVFALCLSLSLCLGLPLPALAFASPFTDVQETSPYYEKYVIPEAPMTACPRPPPWLSAPWSSPGTT